MTHPPTEIALDRLPVGGRFRLHLPSGTTRTGTLISKRTGFCTVEIDGQRVMHTFLTKDGPVSVPTGKTARTTWSPLTPVEDLHERVQIPEPAQSPNPRPVQKEIPMATKQAVQSAPAPSSLLMRWGFFVKQLAKQIDDGNEAAIQATRGRLRGIYNQAQGAVPPVALPRPQVGDEVFEGMTLSNGAPAAGGAVTASKGKAKAKPHQPTKAERGAEAVSKRARAKQAAKPPAAPKAKRTLNPCGCGCGAEVPRRFQQGHDAKANSLLRRVAAEEEPLKKVPAITLTTLNIDASLAGVKAYVRKLKH